MCCFYFSFYFLFINFQLSTFRTRFSQLSMSQFPKPRLQNSKFGNVKLSQFYSSNVSNFKIPKKSNSVFQKCWRIEFPRAYILDAPIYIFSWEGDVPIFCIFLIYLYIYIFFIFLEEFWYIPIINKDSQGVKHPEIMEMLGFGTSHNKTEILLDQNSSKEFPGAYKSILF